MENNAEVQVGRMLRHRNALLPYLFDSSQQKSWCQNSQKGRDSKQGNQLIPKEWGNVCRKKTTKQISGTNRKTIEGIKIRNTAGPFFRDRRIIDEIGWAEIKPRPGYSRQGLYNDQKIYLPGNQPHGRQNWYDNTTYQNNLPIPQSISTATPIAHRYNACKRNGDGDDGVGNVGKSQISEHEYGEERRGDKYGKTKTTVKNHIFPEISDV